MKKIKELYDDIMELTGEITKDHVGAYAAQTAFFFMLCMIPIILLLLTMVQYTPVTKADVMTAVIQVFPSSVDSLITSIVNQVYNQSSGIIPITIVVALWSAGKGVLAMSSGLNCVYNCRETRNYFFLRIRATVYTVMFILVIIFLLVLSVFGNSLNIFIAEHVPFLRNMAGPNHVLPTNGTAKFFSPLSVDDFIKKSSIISYSENALRAIHEDIEAFATAEHLTAHANSIKVRFEK